MEADQFVVTSSEENIEIIRVCEVAETEYEYSLFNSQYDVLLDKLCCEVERNEK